MVGQNRTGQDSAGQNRTGQDRVRGANKDRFEGLCVKNNGNQGK